MPSVFELSVFLIDAAWGVFFVVWFLLAWNNKKSSFREPWRQRIIYFFPGAVVLFLFQHVPALRVRFLPRDSAVGLIGAALCCLGVAFCIWARLHLGRNWSGFVTIKQDHELIQSGPYRFVRHPIYTGLLAALAGTLLAVTPSWGGVLTMALIFCAFLFKLRQEEKVMLRQFPEAYPRYMARVKRLIPLVL